MAAVINTNVMSLNAQRQLGNSQNTLNTAMERLSSGLRINSAKDDAAGMAIAERMTSQVKGLNQATRNANDGISLAQTAEGALQESSNILQRMRELAVQSANDTNSAEDRASLQKEVSQLQSELNRIANTTTFNGKKLLDGDFGSAKFHVGAEADQTINVTTGDMRANKIGTNKFEGTNLATATNTAANGGAADTLKIAGSLGNSDVTVGAGDSARDVAAAVNKKANATGVNASAITNAQIGNVAATGVVAFDLNGQNEAAGEAIRVTANIADTADLSDLAKAINDVAGKTGVTATLSDDKASLVMQNSEGYDITLKSAAGTQSFDLTGLEADGATAVGGAQTIAAGGDGSVGGVVTFDSAKSYTVETQAASLTAAAAVNASALESVSDVNIGTQRGSNDALKIIDSALDAVSDLRADLGATQNRFQSTISNLQNVSENVQASRSRIMDADFAAETAALSKGQVLQQAGQAMLSQANSAPQGVLSLLR